MINDTRPQKALELRRRGMTYREIGQELRGLSVERARQLVRKGEKQESGAQPTYWHSGLSTGTANVLQSAGLRSREDVVGMLTSSPGKLAEIQDIGKVRLNEVCRWAGVPAPNHEPSPAYIARAIKALERHGYATLEPADERTEGILREKMIKRLTASGLDAKEIHLKIVERFGKWVTYERVRQLVNKLAK